MSDLIDTDDILNHLRERKLSRDEIYRLSDAEGFGFIIKSTNKNQMYEFQETQK